MPIVQAATAYANPEKGETTILILNKAIWMGETMDHNLVNPNQLRAYSMTVQYNPFVEAPISIATEDHNFMLPLYSKGIILGVTTRTPAEKELQICPHVTCSSAHDWDPHNVILPKSSRTVEDKIERKIGAVMTEVRSTELTDTENYSNSADKIYDIDAITSRMIGSVKLFSITSSNLYETKATVQDVTQAETFQSKGCHSIMSPEELSDRWQIGIEQARDTITKTTQTITCSSVIPLVKRYKADRVFQTKIPTGMWDIYTMHGRVKYLYGNRYAHVFSNETYFY